MTKNLKAAFFELEQWEKDYLKEKTNKCGEMVCHKPKPMLTRTK